MSALIEGEWRNSYCSLVALSQAEDGLIIGNYSSHTGSAGTYDVVGFAGAPAAAGGSGTPVALVIQWRAINKTNDEGDNSWHWVSNFGGQAFPAQQQGHQDIPETLEVLNGLLATSPLAGLTDTAPHFWLQTLDFHREAPAHCRPAAPATPVAYTGGAEDLVSGTWRDLFGATLTLEADAARGENAIVGSYVSPEGERFRVVGLRDAYAPGYKDGTVVAQSLALAMRSEAGPSVLSMAGMVPLSVTGEMTTWDYVLASTPWTSRYTGLELQSRKWIRADDRSCGQRGP